MTQRRQILAALATLPVAAWAQSGKVPRIGFLTPGTNPREAAFWKAMRDYGYIEGKSVVVDRRSADGDFSRLDALAAEIVRNRPDVIVAVASAAAIAAKQATSTVPIVFIGSSDPVAAGLVGNLARPGGNVTGTATQTRSAVGKLIELVREILPSTKRVVALWDPVNTISQQLRIGETFIAAAQMRILVGLVDVRSRADLDRAFEVMQSTRPDAVLVASDTFFIANADRVAELGITHRLPVMGTTRSLVEAGVLASVGPNVDGFSRRSAAYVSRILKGAKPGELPVELPSRFELVINMQTASAIGLAIPSGVLARADEVIR